MKTSNNAQRTHGTAQSLFGPHDIVHGEKNMVVPGDQRRQRSGAQNLLGARGRTNGGYGYRQQAAWHGVSIERNVAKMLSA